MIMMWLPSSFPPLRTEVGFDVVPLAILEPQVAGRDDDEEESQLARHHRRRRWLLLPLLLMLLLLMLLLLLPSTVASVADPDP